MSLAFFIAFGSSACRGSSPRAAGTSSSTQPTGGIGESLATLLAHPEQGLDPSVEEQADLTRTYIPGSEKPLWLDDALRPTRNAVELLTALGDAASEGLEPSDYRAESLAASKTGLETGNHPPPRDAAAFDMGLSLSMLRYLKDFHRGRVNPKDIGFLMALPVDDHDYAALVQTSAHESKVKETIASMTPPLVQYRILRSMLPRYRTLAQAEGTTLKILPPAPAKSIKPGALSPPFDLMSALHARLVGLGDLPETAAPFAEGGAYDGEIVSGVKHFQLRHGLEGDGVLGKTTWVALNVPLKWRLRQIELAMERMRWLPHLGERAFVAVNIPMFRLWGWDSVPETGAPTFGMGVIVGKALDTRTPVFLEEMKHLIFQPYWNVPKSILQKEILPILQRDTSYLEKQDMEIVKGESDDATPVEPSSKNLKLLADGKLRVRQRPGPKNALGQVKFMFPNDENVYLHGTPAPQLFGRARRDFSHGCVRVEDPLALALWALKDQPEWTREKILAAMNGKPSLVVPLTRPIRVVLYYVTATVIPDENAIHFAEDIYDQDPGLDKALIARR